MLPMGYKYAFLGLHISNMLLLPLFEIFIGGHENKCRYIFVQCLDICYP